MSCDRKSTAPKTENVTSAAAVDVNDKLSNCLTNSKKILKVSLELHLPHPLPRPSDLTPVREMEGSAHSNVPIVSRQIVFCCCCSRSENKMSWPSQVWADLILYFCAVRKICLIWTGRTGAFLCQRKFYPFGNSWDSLDIIRCQAGIWTRVSTNMKSARSRAYIRDLWRPLLLIAAK